jgi:hypothetical protein
MISYKTCVVVSKVSKRVFPYYIWILIIYCSFKKREEFVRLAAGRWFSQYTPPIKQDSHDITVI